MSTRRDSPTKKIPTSATATELQRLYETFTVYQVGSNVYAQKFDGTLIDNGTEGTNDARVINAAIAALPAAGGTVALKGDVYGTEAGVAVGVAGAELRGENGAVIKPNTGVTADGIAVNANDVDIVNLAVDMTNITSGTIGSGISTGVTSPSLRTLIRDNSVVNSLSAAGKGAIQLGANSGPSYIFANRISTVGTNVGHGINVAATTAGHHIFQNRIDGYNVGGTAGINVGATVTNSIIDGNDVSGCTTGMITPITSTSLRVVDNPGYNPVGTIATPFPAATGTLGNLTQGNAAPASAAVITNIHTPKTLIMTGGTVTVVALNGVTVATVAGSYWFKLGIGETIAVTYSVVPTFTVRAD